MKDFFNPVTIAMALLLLVLFLCLSSMGDCDPLILLVLRVQKKLRQLTSQLKSRRRDRRSRDRQARRAAYKPIFEGGLEDRTVPSTLFVTNTNSSGKGSLPAALQAAPAGSTIEFRLPGGSGTINLPNGLAITAPVSIVNTNPPSQSNPNPWVITLTTYGKAPIISVNLAHGGTVNLTGLTFYGFSGADIVKQPGGTLNVNSSSFQGWQAIQDNGGMLSATNNTFNTLTGIKLSAGNLALTKDNFADSSGGLSGQTSGNVTLISSTFSGASTVPAVQLTLTGSGSLSTTGGSFNGNYSGALCVAGGLSNQVSLNTMVATGNFGGTPVIKIVGCQASINQIYVGGNGAQAVAYNSNNGANLTMTNSTIAGNTPYLSTIAGAGVWVNAVNRARITLANDTIAGNLLRGGTQNGGGIAFVGNKTASISITACTIMSNVATFQGGGIYVAPSVSAPVVDDNLIQGNSIAGASAQGFDVWGAFQSALNNNNIIGVLNTQYSTGWVKTDVSGTINQPFSLPVQGLNYNFGNKVVPTIAPYFQQLKPVPPYTTYGDQRRLNTKDANGVLWSKIGVVIAGACTPFVVQTGPPQ